MYDITFVIDGMTVITTVQADSEDEARQKLIDEVRRAVKDADPVILTVVRTTAHNA